MEVPQTLRPILQRPLLSSEDQRFLLERAQEGDVVALNDLTMGYSRMVVKLTAWDGFTDMREDMIQEGFLILRRAILRFEPRRGVALHNWLAQQLRWRLLKVVQKETHYRQHTELRDEAAGPEVLQRTGTGLSKRVEESADEDPAVELWQLIERALEADEITDEHVDVLEAKLQGIPMRELAELKGVCRQAMDRRFAKAVKALAGAPLEERVAQVWSARADA